MNDYRSCYIERQKVAKEASYGTLYEPTIVQPTDGRVRFIGHAHKSSEILRFPGPESRSNVFWQLHLHLLKFLS